jgi:hypothetical protein
MMFIHSDFSFDKVFGLPAGPLLLRLPGGTGGILLLIMIKSRVGEKDDVNADPTRLGQWRHSALPPKTDIGRLSGMPISTLQ